MIEELRALLATNPALQGVEEARLWLLEEIPTSGVVTAKQVLENFPNAGDIFASFKATPLTEELLYQLRNGGLDMSNNNISNALQSVGVDIKTFATKPVPRYRTIGLERLLDDDIKQAMN